MLCPKCNSDHAHNSHRRGFAERLASVVAFYPYRCRKCGHRFMRFAFALKKPAAALPVEREIRRTRGNMRRLRLRRDVFLYSIAAILILFFIRYITRERQD